MTIELTQIRHIGIITHIEARKTTTTEQMIFYSGYAHALC